MSGRSASCAWRMEFRWVRPSRGCTASSPACPCTSGQAKRLRRRATSPRRGADTGERRVLVLAPIGRDASVACEVLEEAGLMAEACPDGRAVARAAAEAVGALVLTEEVTSTDDLDALERFIARQPPWSDLPVLVFASIDPASLAGRELLDRLGPLGNVTVLERPVHRATLISAVQAALRARDRQYEVRDLLAQHEKGLRMRDEFLAMLGHELRNPLAAIRNTMNAMELGSTADDADGLRLRPRDRALITRQLTHLSRLVDDLLDVSRVTSGKIVLKWERVDLADLVTRCANALEDVARSRALELTVDAGDRKSVV